MRATERRKLLARKLESFTPRTITEPLALERELVKVRRSGHAVDREEITRGIMCVAAPILDDGGETVAAVSTAFPTYVIEERGIKDEIRAVTWCASEATRLLAGEPDGYGASRRGGGHLMPIAKKRR
jgi:DNA-binding IclR family transcriptional regulator